MKKIALIILFVFLLPNPALAQRSLLQQRIEILRHEVSVLRMLTANMRINQDIVADSYLAFDIENKKVLLEKNSNKSYPIASITKLMSGLVASENIRKEEKISLTNEMLQPLGQSPCLYSGAAISSQDLIKASLIQSSNDAPEALAIHLGKDRFLNLMNLKAQELGMRNTSFHDVHGLSPLNQSTASDLAKLLNYVYKNKPELLSITRDNDFWLPNSSGQMLKFQNVNNFYYLSSFVGGKTGYLPQARQTIASVFNVKQKPVAVVVLYSTNRQADIFTIFRSLP